MAASLCVLVADDSELVRRFLARALAEMGHRTVTAANGADLYQKALTAAPDLLIVDVHMPGEGGLQVLARLRARPEVRVPPAVVLSATIDDDLIARAADLGVSAFLEKGTLDIKTIRQAVQKALASPSKSAPVPSAASPAPAATTAGRPTLDRQRLMAQADNDPELLEHMLSLFRKGCPEALAGLSEAVAAGAAPALRLAAHRLKGMLKMLAADRAAQTAARLEEMAAAGQLTGAAAGLARLQAQLQDLEAELRQLRVG